MLAREAFEHVFYTCRPNVDYNKKSLNILNLKWSCFVYVWKMQYGRNLSSGQIFLCLRKKARSHNIQKAVRLLSIFKWALEFCQKRAEKKKIVFFPNYEIIYPRLITSLKWHYDDLFFERKKKRKTVFDKLCENTVDVIYQTFTRKHYLVRISQSKTSHIYCKKKKGGGCCLRKRMCFTAEFLMSLEVFLVGFVKNRHFWRKEFF